MRKPWQFFLCVILLLSSWPLAGLAGDGLAHWQPPPRLGARVVDVPFPELERLNLDHGIRILNLLPGGAALRAGLASGDIILALNGKPAYSVDRLGWLLSRAPDKSSVSLSYRRDAETRTVTLNLTESALPPVWPQAPGVGETASYLGVLLQSLDADLREAFGIDSDQGVLVSEVMRGSPAEQVGIQAGDVIIRLDEQAVASVLDLRSAMAHFRPGDQVRVRLVRNAKPMDLQVTLQASPNATEQALSWQYPNRHESLGEMLPPPEYWRQLMDRMMESLQDSWGEYRRDMPESQQPYQ